MQQHDPNGSGTPPMDEQADALASALLTSWHAELRAHIPPYFISPGGAVHIDAVTYLAGLCDRQLRRLREAGKGPFCYHTRPGTAWLYPLRDLAQWLTAERDGSP